MHKYKTYIFDLDGTLLSTLADLAASTNYALRTHHMPERSLDEVRRFVGNGVKKLMERAIPDGLNNPLFEETFATFRQHSCSITSTPRNPTPASCRCLSR